MNRSSASRFFFLHVMKAAGGTFREHVLANFERDEVYPYYDVDPPEAYYRMEYLLALPPERRMRTRAYTGHFPFVASELLGDPVITLVILREPIERTISYLKRHQELRDPDHSLEEIYEAQRTRHGGVNFQMFIRDHQAKVFSLTRDDEPQDYRHVIEVDARRLELAKENLETVDVLGLQEHFGEFLDEVAQRFGWQIESVTDRHVSNSEDVSNAFRQRIADDNAVDLEFYEYARDLYAGRRGAAAAPGRTVPVIDAVPEPRPVEYRHDLLNDRWAIELVHGGMTNGYFVEAGASAGVHGSATFVLEQQFGWNGICVEPVDEHYERLVKRRACRTDDRCLWDRSGETVSFTYYPEFTSRSGVATDNKNVSEMEAKGATGVLVEKQTVTLADLLREHDAPPVIHYLCLDIEGAEPRVLAAFDFAGPYRILALSIEGGHCNELMREAGYLQVRNPLTDQRFERYFVHPSMRARVEDLLVE
jgi:FkbM family methyltransferase